MIEEVLKLINEEFEKHSDNYKINGKTDFDAGRLDGLKIAIEIINSINS